MCAPDLILSSGTPPYMRSPHMVHCHLETTLPAHLLSANSLPAWTLCWPFAFKIPGLLFLSAYLDLLLHHGLWHWISSLGVNPNHHAEVSYLWPLYWYLWKWKLWLHLSQWFPNITEAKVTWVLIKYFDSWALLQTHYLRISRIWV